MRQPLRIKLITTQQEFDEFVVFAKDFDHDESHAMAPIYMVYRGDRPIAYFKVNLNPVIYPSFNPKECSHRDFYEICDKVKTWRQLNSFSDQWPHGTAFIAVENDPAIDPSIISKLGFVNTNTQIWRADG